MVEKSYPGVGMLMSVLVAFAFYGSCASVGAYLHGRHSETVAIKHACETLIGYGWETSVSDCVGKLRP